MATASAENSRATSVSTTAARMPSLPRGKARYTVARDRPAVRAISSTVVLAIPWRLRQSERAVHDAHSRRGAVVGSEVAEDPVTPPSRQAGVGGPSQCRSRAPW